MATRKMAPAAAAARRAARPYRDPGLSPAVPNRGFASSAAPTSSAPSRPKSFFPAEAAPRPFSDFLTDGFARQHDYLRISLTERCNLRCVYCMPEEGVQLSPPRELLTTPEIVLLSSVFVGEGVRKIRLTGGEPTVRRDIVPLVRRLGELRARGLRDLAMTTNGIALHRRLEPLVEAGLTAVNLSLDTLDPMQFQVMTRRKGLDAVLRSIERVLELNRHRDAGVRLKVNCVVMRGLNDHEILPFVEMTRERDMEVRFIEYMPFGGNRWDRAKMLGYGEMLDRIRAAHPGLERAAAGDAASDVSKTWRVPGFAGRVGFITSMTHNFCGSCNRLRITSDGNLKVCLFGNAEVSLRDILRESNDGEPIDEAALEAMQRLEDHGLEEMDGAGGRAGSEEPRLLGLGPRHHELLEVIGMAVKRKKEKHAGLGQLEHMPNRPMILIDHRASHTTPGGRSALSSTATLRAGQRHHRPVPTHMLGVNTATPAGFAHARLFSSTTRHPRLPRGKQEGEEGEPRQAETAAADGRQGAAARLTHVSDSGSAHMVSIADKAASRRVARAACSVRFSAAAAAALVRENQMRKGDVLGVARVAGIMAAKRTADLVPLCHPIALSRVAVDLVVHVGGEDGEEGGQSRVDIEARVACEGRTGVEMEALTAASVAALTVYDMCKAVDKRMRIEGLRVVLKEGGRSGRWVEGEPEPEPEPGTERGPGE